MLISLSYMPLQQEISAENICEFHFLLAIHELNISFDAHLNDRHECFFANGVSYEEFTIAPLSHYLVAINFAYTV